MQISMTMVYAPGAAAPQRVIVDAEPGATAADLARALHAGEAGAYLVVDGAPVRPDTPVGMPPLLRDAVVTVRQGSPPAPPSSAATRSACELWVLSGPDEGTRLPLPAGRSIVGRSSGSAVRLVDPSTSRRHAEIEVTGSQVTVRDLAGTNGSQVNGIPLTSAPTVLSEADVLQLGSTQLVLRAGPRPSAATRPDGHGHLLFSSAPRGRPGPGPSSVSFPDAPVATSRSRFPMLALLVPLALAGVLSAVMRSPTMLLFGLSGPVLSFGAWVSDRRGGSGRRRAAHGAYVEAVATAEAALGAATQWEAAALQAYHPPLAGVLGDAEARSTRLWERRVGDADVMEVRLGLGSLPSAVRVDGGTAPLPPLLHGAPVTVDLARVGVLGVCGPRELSLRTAGAVVARLATCRSPRELEIVVLAESLERSADWHWVSRLPHSGDDFVVASTAAARMRRLTKEIAERESATSPVAERHVLVVMDGAARLRELPGVDTLLRRGPAAGMFVLAIDQSQERLPAHSGAVLVLVAGNDPGRSHRNGMRVTPTMAHLSCDGQVVDLTPDLPTSAWVARLSAALGPLRDAAPGPSGTQIPVTVRLLDLLAPGGAGAADLTDRWRRHGPHLTGTRVVLGATADGPLAVDLRTDGPHVLVAGTTGAGKSELLQTLVCSLALENRPDEMAFVLVDYKGGAAFTGCAALPHVVGLVTDLDAHLTRRALVSLAAELRRRERLLAGAGVGALEGYQRRRDLDARAGPPLPRLCIVIDEFRVLAEEHPDFVHGLVRLAAVGRSLGVHLVLATQRPGGIVSADIRANVSLRIALRVRDRSDSVDIVEAPDAASITASTAGRAYVRGAATPLTEFQAARVTGAPPPDGRRITVTPERPWWLRTSPPDGDGVSSAPTGTEGVDVGPTDLDAIVAAARDAYTRLAIPAVAPPWLPPLPDVVELSALPSTGGGVAIGLLDDPSGQVQLPWCWQLEGDGHLGIAGGPGSGRTTSALTVAAALATAWAPGDLHLYAIGPARLAVLDQLPHTAARAALDDPEHVALVVDRLRSVVGGAQRPVDARQPPWSVLIVDGWEQLATLSNGTLAAEIRALLDMGAGAGLRAVVTGGRAVLSGQLASAMSERLVLRVSDAVELAMAGIPARAVPTHQPPGRAVHVRSHHEVQLAVPDTEPARRQGDGPVAGPDERVFREITGRWAQCPDRPRPVHRLPPLVSSAGLADTDAGMLVVGVREGDLAPCGFAPDRGERRLVVAGPHASGRTVTLATLARAAYLAGFPVAVVGTKLSTLTGGSAIMSLDGRAAEDRDRLVEVRRDQRDLAVIVDDVECLQDTPMEAVLQEIARLVDDDHGLVVVSTTLFALDAHGARLAAELARARTGVVLGPPAGAHAFGVAMPTGSTTTPGRGLLVRGGTLLRIQVATPP